MNNKQQINATNEESRINKQREKEKRINKKIAKEEIEKITKITQK